MTTDPVCGMRVDDNDSQHQAQYGGQTYSFCSQQCKNEFEQNPEQYARSGGLGQSEQNSEGPCFGKGLFIAS